MWNAIIIRRERLGRTSIKGISLASTTGIQFARCDRLGRRRLQPYPDRYDTLIRWGYTGAQPIDRVINTVEAIRQVNNKAGFRRLIECPHTLYSDTPYAEADLTEGVVVRPAQHAQGRNLWVARTVEEMHDAIRRAGPGWYATKFFPKTHEFRVFVANGRAVWVARKTPGNPDDVAWNVARGGRFDNVRFADWPLKVVKTAIEAFNKTSLDFGGVDVMWHEPSREARVLEINSAPSQTSPYRQGCCARAFDWMCRNEDKERIPLPNERGGYRKFIHPGITEEARHGGE